MAFNFKKSSNTAVLVPELIQVPATNAEAFVVGEALKLSSGAVTKAAGTDVPKYISAEAKTAKTGESLTCFLIENNQQYETVLSTDGTLAVGTKYTISSDGLKVTATSTTGVAEVISVAGTTAGSAVVVRF